VKATATAEATKPLPPRDSAADALAEKPDGGVEIGDHTTIHLAEAFRGEGVEVFEEGGDSLRPGEEEEDELSAAAVMIAGCTGGDDDSHILAAPAPRSGDHMLTGQRTIRGGGGPAVHTPSVQQPALQLDAERTGWLGILRHGTLQRGVVEKPTAP
jgi:hypothetical protein